MKTKLLPVQVIGLDDLYCYDIADSQTSNALIWAVKQLGAGFKFSAEDLFQEALQAEGRMRLLPRDKRPGCSAVVTRAGSLVKMVRDEAGWTLVRAGDADTIEAKDTAYRATRAQIAEIKRQAVAGIGIIETNGNTK